MFKNPYFLFGFLYLMFKNHHFLCGFVCLMFKNPYFLHGFLESPDVWITRSFAKLLSEGGPMKDGAVDPMGPNMLPHGPMVQRNSRSTSGQLRIAKK